MIKYFSLISLLILSLVSCTNELEHYFTGGEVTTINVSAEEFQTATRTTIDNTNYSVKWSDSDVIGIFPMEEGSRQIAFDIKNGSNSNNASFDGKGWGLKNGTSYAAYYPYNANGLLDKTNILLDYTGQTQTGNNSTSHLGAYDFMFASSTNPDNGILNLKFKHIGTLLHFQISQPYSVEYSKVTISTDGSFYTQARLNLKTNEVFPIEDSKTKKLEMELNNAIMNSVDGYLDIYLMALPVDLTGHMITVCFRDEHGFERVMTWNGKNLCDGQYEINKNTESVIPYITFKAEEAQTLKMSKAVETLEYSVNGGEWKELGTEEVSFGGFNGDVKLRGKNPHGTSIENSVSGYYSDGNVFYEEANYSTISFGNNTPVDCCGDIRTLIDYNKYSFVDTSNAQFIALFRDCTSIRSAPDLPIKKLSKLCYAQMFQGCTGLISAPELPATDLADYCYANMFSECVSLTETPKLPATSLMAFCYSSMFAGTLIEAAPDLHAMVLAPYCYANMFKDCTSLTKAPELPATDLADYCYASMFSECASLKEAPELLATNLAKSCYSNMFQDCTNLNYIKMMATDNDVSDCLVNWTLNVASTGTFIKNAEATWYVNGNDGVPFGWRVIEEKPNTINGHEYVDLGITDENGNTVYWATTNVGTKYDPLLYSYENYYGDYFAWGETKARGEEDTSNEHNYAYGNTYKKTYYDWSTYKWSSGDSWETISKYSFADNQTQGCWYEESNYVGLDGVKNQRVLESKDDAAAANWGKGWRMPTSSELLALVENCYWEWHDHYSPDDGSWSANVVSGYIVYKAKSNADKGKHCTYQEESPSPSSYSQQSDAHIFLPASGSTYYHTFSRGGGYYWSSELSHSSNEARVLEFGSGLIWTTFANRRNGYSVRPVYVKQN